MSKSTKKIVSTEHAPAAVGPYSQAIAIDGWLWTSGQVALDPATGKLVGDDAPTQAEQVFKNLESILTAAGTGFDNVVRATVYLTSMDDFQAVNEVYARHFPGEPPARACVEVCRLPVGGLVEIDVVARLG